jgi:hypothetical protein
MSFLSCHSEQPLTTSVFSSQQAPPRNRAQYEHTCFDGVVAAPRCILEGHKREHALLDERSVPRHQGRARLIESMRTRRGKHSARSQASQHDFWLSGRFSLAHVKRLRKADSAVPAMPAASCADDELTSYSSMVWRMYMHICIYIYIYVCVCVSVYVYNVCMHACV